MTTKYQIDPSHSSANFSVKHMMIAKVHGGFEKMDGIFFYDREDPARSSVEVSIEAASINTREPKRDEHLKSEDFFDVKKYPTLSFKSSKFEIKGDELIVIGDLTIHGVTKQVAIDIEKPSEEMKDPWGQTKIGVSGKTKIKRKDFGLNWNATLEAGGILVGDEIEIRLDVQLIKQ